MPWKVKGKKVYKYENGKWKVKQTCESEQNAHKAKWLLEKIERGEIKK